MDLKMEIIEEDAVAPTEEIEEVITEDITKTLASLLVMPIGEIEELTPIQIEEPIQTQTEEVIIHFQIKALGLGQSPRSNVTTVAEQTMQRQSASLVATAESTDITIMTVTQELKPWNNRKILL